MRKMALLLALGALGGVVAGAALTGGTKVKNESEQIVKTYMDVINSSTAECRSALTQEQLFSLAASGPGSVIDLGTVNASQTAQVDTRCYQTNVASTNVENKIDQLAKQQLDVITQTLSLSSTDTENINKSLIELKESVLNDTKQSCSNLAGQAQVVNVTASDGGIVKANSLNWSQTFNGITQCVQNSTSVIDAKNNIQQIIDQYNKTEVKDNLSTILIIIGVVIAVIVIGIVIAVVMAAPSVASTAGSVAKIASPVPF